MDSIHGDTQGRCSVLRTALDEASQVQRRLVGRESFVVELAGHAGTGHDDEGHGCEPDIAFCERLVFVRIAGYCE